MDKEIKCYRLAKRYPGSPAVGIFVIAVDDDDYTDGDNYYPNEIEHHWEHWEIVPLNEGITWDDALEMVRAVSNAISH